MSRLDSVWAKNFLTFFHDVARQVQQYITEHWHLIIIRISIAAIALPCGALSVGYRDLSVWNNRHEEMRVKFAAGLNHMHAGIDGLGMPG